MSDTIKDRMLFICILAAAGLSTYSRITSPNMQLDNPYKDTVYDSLDKSTAPKWYYDSFTKEYEGKLAWERHKAELLRRRVEGTTRVIEKSNNASTGVYHIDALNHQANNKEKEKGEQEKLADIVTGALKKDDMTPMQKMILQQILIGLSKDSKAKEKIDVEKEKMYTEEESKDSSSFVEKMEKKLNIDTKEVINKVNDNDDRGFNFGIFKLNPRKDHSNLDTKTNLLDKNKLRLASSSYDSYYGGYGYSNDSIDDSNGNDYYDYGDIDSDYNYESLEVDSVTPDNYEEQFKKYQSGLSPAEKQKLLKNREDYQKYESYKGAKSIDDYQKQMSDFMNDENSINNLVNDVGADFNGDSVDSNGDYGKVRDLFSNQKIDKKQIENFQNNNSIFNNSNGIYNKVKKDINQNNGK